MGVDLAVYRARIGQFVPRPVNGMVSNIDYLCKAIASVRGGLIRQDELNSKGAVTFIDLLLRAQGIEPNPGPGKRGQRSVPDEQPEENDDVSIHLDSNVNPISADRISQFVESFLPASNPTNIGSSQIDEYAGAVAIPGPSSGAIVKTTIVPQMVINYHDNRKYNEEIRVENMKVKNAENVCTGEQTIIHTVAPTGDEDDDVTKPNKKRDEEKGVVLKSPERNASEDSNADPNIAGRISQAMEPFLPVSNPTDTGSSQTDEHAGAVAIPGPSSGAIAKTTIVSQVVINYHDKREYNEEIYIENMKVKTAENVCTGEQTIIYTGQAGDNEDEDIPKQRKKSDKRFLLEENEETMIKRYDEETASLLVTRTGAKTANHGTQSGTVGTFRKQESMEGTVIGARCSEVHDILKRSCNWGDMCIMVVSLCFCICSMFSTYRLHMIGKCLSCWD